MALVLRRLGRVELARSFYRDIKNDNDFFHFAIGRTLPWTDDTVPETPIDSDAYIAEFRRSMMFTQRIDSADICMLAKRTNWASGTVYDEYDDTYSSVNQSHSGAQTLADANFFVITDEFKVYKCISNNGGAESVIKPITTGTDVDELSDNYDWKFMFQISASDQNKFLDADYIPVRKVTGNPIHDVNGEVDSITITAAGTGYTDVFEVGIDGDGTGAQGMATISGGAVTGVTISDAGSGYSFAFVNFNGGDGTGATGKVLLGDAEVGTNVLQGDVERAAQAGTVDRIELASGGLDYADGDVVISVTGDGTGAEAAAYVNATTGALTSIAVTSKGQNYSYASIVITNTTAPGSGAIARAVISPQGGHGSNATRELFANNLGLTVSFSDNTNPDLILGNDFRQIALIKNIMIEGWSESTDQYITNTGTACYIITVASGQTANYSVDDIITTDDGGEFVVIQIDEDNLQVYLTATIPLITNTSTLENTTKSLTGLSINSVTAPEVDNATGEIIYLDNRSPITRSADQVEQIKALIRF